MERQITLGDVIAPAKVLRCDNDDYPVLSMTMHDGIVLQSDRFKKSLASIDQSNYKVVLRGQLVVGFPIDEGVIYVQNITEAGIMSPAYGVWNIHSKEIMPEYLELCLHSPQSMDYYKNKLRGTTARRRSITTGDLLALPITLPSLTEQKRRIGLLKQATLLLNSQKQAMLKFDELVKSRFVEMFGAIPESEFVTMESVCSLITDGTHQPPKFVDNGIPFLFVSNITTNELTYDADKFISSETYDDLMKRTPVEIGDILLSTVGSYGHPAVVKSDRKFSFQRHIAFLKPRKDVINSIYLHGVILTSDIQRQIDARVKGIAQKTLNLSEIRTLRFPLPPMKEQNRFAAFVAEVDKSKLSYEMEVAA